MATSLLFKIGEDKVGQDIVSLDIDINGRYSTYSKDINDVKHNFSQPYPTTVSETDKIRYASAIASTYANTIIDDLKTQSGQSDISPTTISYEII